ncbi:MAG: hypothetical protein QGI78_01595 [Phycisphaerales bacterium]|jgi:hypothetical protein|nr:hypothetical protein [Phycisphaerales bacterium]
MRNLHTIVSILLVLSIFSSCKMYAPGGNAFFNAPDSAATWESTEEFPKTITIIDTRSGEEVFVMEIPVGKQLVVDFESDGGDDPVETPDLMRWAIFPNGTGWGALNNAMTVPNRWSRRLDVTIRDSSEYAPEPEHQEFRVDNEEDRPDWWTSEGGEIDVYDPVDGYE